MHLALVGPTYPFRGGIAHYTTMLTIALRARGHTVDLCTFSGGYLRALYPGRSDRDPSAQPLRTAAHAMLHPLRPWTWRSTGRWIAARRPDLVLVEWWVPFWAPPLATLAATVRRAGVPLVMDCQNVLPHERHPFDQALTALTLRQADACLVYASAHRRELESVVPGMPWAQVPFPAYTALAAQPIGPAAARRLLGLPDGPTALFIGFVRPYKGLSVLIEALARAVQHVPLRLVVAGEFWQDRSAYERQIAALGLTPQITMVDRYLPDEELARYLEAADLVVLPYLEPVQSGVLAVAQAFRRPVIASRVGGLQEGIAEGRTGLLVPVGDPTALADALVRFVREDLATAMAPHLAATTPAASWDTLIRALADLAAAAAAGRLAHWAMVYDDARGS